MHEQDDIFINVNVINKIVESETQEILPFGKMQDEQFEVPEHLKDDFEHNTVDYDKTIYDMNVKEEIAKLKEQIANLENQINSLQQPMLNLLNVINSVAATQNVSALNSLYAIQQTNYIQSSLCNPYNPFYNTYNPLYDLRVQSCCNGYKGGSK